MTEIGSVVGRAFLASPPPRTTWIRLRFKMRTSLTNSWHLFQTLETHQVKQLIYSFQNNIKKLNFVS